MLKAKVTKKDILESYYNVISIGYCNAQYLLQGLEPQFYTCGIYGWNADIYQIDYSTVIVTGYRPFSNLERDYDLLKKYEERAEKVWGDYSLDYDKRKEKVNKLLKEFVTITKANGKRY